MFFVYLFLSSKFCLTVCRTKDALKNVTLVSLWKKLIDLPVTIFLAYYYRKIDMLTSFHHHRSMKGSRQIPQKLANRLKFVLLSLQLNQLVKLFWQQPFSMIANLYFTKATCCAQEVHSVMFYCMHPVAAKVFVFLHCKGIILNGLYFILVNVSFPIGCISICLFLFIRTRILTSSAQHFWIFHTIKPGTYGKGCFGIML